jgi:hypothetical protein
MAMAESVTAISQLAKAFKELAGYALVSGAFFLIDAAIYSGFFVAYRPKYTFLFGNTLLAVLVAIEIAGCLLYYCTRGAGSAAWLRLAVGGLSTAALLLYGIHATVITIVERSVSINVLRFLADGEAREYDTIERNFVETFVARDKAVCKRLDEQIRLGSVVHEGGRYAITPKGLRTFRMLEAANLITGDKYPKNAVSCDEREAVPHPKPSVRAPNAESPPDRGAVKGRDPASPSPS